MHARNRRTGAAITGTLERLYARCKLIEDGFGRAENGTVTHEHEGGTEFFYDTSETVRTDGERTYLDENGGHVVESDIVLHEPDVTASKPPERPHALEAARSNDARDASDPEAAARGIAERFIASMVAEIDDYQQQTSIIETTAEDEDPHATENAVFHAHHTLTRNAANGVEKIEIASGLVDLQTARDALVPIVRHVNAAVLHINGPNAIRLRCVREDSLFRVDEVTAREYGRIARVRPDKASAAQVDVYANAILNAWGL